MAEVLTPDICVIGAGSGGLAVAEAAAAFGVPVVLIEQHKMGGSSLNTGTVPSKALLAAANRAAAMRDSATFGLTVQGAGVDFAKVHAHVRRVTAAIALNNSAERFTGLGVRVIKGHASFKDRRTVTVGDIDIRARRFVIATGSSPAVPPIQGLAQSPYFTDETIFTLTSLPKHLIVIGARAIGLEFAQAFRRLGSEVTVLEAAQPLAEEYPEADPEAFAIVVAALERDGVVIRSGATIAKVDCAVGDVTVTLDGDETIAGTHLLVASGRKANTDGLNLDAGGIAFDATGILVNKKLKTRNSRVYAIGDVASGQRQSTHAAQYHAGLVIRNALFRQSVRVDNDAVPWITYTEPELAQAGLTETEARKRGLKIRILRWPYHDNDRAQIERETHGHIKVITTMKGRIVGVTIVGAQAAELISMWTLAIAQGLDIRAMTNVVIPYPTLSEIGKRAAINYFTPRLTSPWLRRIIAWLRLFG